LVETTTEANVVVMGPHLGKEFELDEILGP
jgi:hypothetical protein